MVLVHPQKRQKRKKENLISVWQNIQLPDRGITHREDKIDVSRVCHEMIIAQSNKQVLTHTHALSRSHNNKKKQ